MPDGLPRRSGDPRWIIARRVDQPPTTDIGTLGLLARRSFGRLARGAEIWHAMPDILARRQEHVAAFEDAWRERVSPGARALRATDPRAQAVLALRLGDDPFRTETQLRTLWT